ncbi:ferric reductase-like transmembrane domain-containing protein [Candidatus Nomurabacteria bacterium]|nr:ferric reductase-like transmembrane domain-containing protein [Candidatus Nomurabacteria bacterium]
MTQTIAFSALLWDLGKYAGVAAFFLLAFLIFSGDTARFWDKFIGLDKIIKFQKKFSYFVAVFVVLHPIFFILSRGQVFNFIIPNFTYVPLALGIIGFYIFVAVMIASALYKKISYKAWQYIHIGTYILFFFTLYHAINWGSDSDKLFVPYIITLALLIIGAIYRANYKLFKSNKFFVESIVEETHDTFTINIKTDKPYKFKAGQFCFLRLDKNKLHARHPFTISSAPSEKNISFTIKNTGRFTETAKNLKAGDAISVDGPFGVFTPPNDGELVFIAGGVGITPFMSIINDRLKNGASQKITLIYGSRNIKDIIFKKVFDSINQDWFKKVYVLSEDGDVVGFSYERGYVSRNIIEKYVKNIKDSMYYICGPELMKNSIKKTLIELGVEKQNIFIEDFFW